MGDSREVSNSSMRSRFTEESAIRKITNSKNKGEVRGKTIYHESPGLSILAAIDFLEKQHKYTWIKVDPKERKRNRGEVR